MGGLFCLLIVSIVWKIFIVSASDVFHVNSKITFYPDQSADYFGYSVLLNGLGLYIGAPKAKSRIRPDISSGDVFRCPLNYLNYKNVTCNPVVRNVIGNVPSNYSVNDMWFGAQLAATADNKLVVCAPRVTRLFKEIHLLANGNCVILGKERHTLLDPLKNGSLQAAIIPDGNRPDYGKKGGHLMYYAYGQSGMSVTYTRDNHLLIGAPGVLQWTGTIVNYAHTPNTNSFEPLPFINPYFTKEVTGDDYFGYSVDSGVFEVKGRVLYVAGAPRAMRGYGLVLIFSPAIFENAPLRIRTKLIGPQLGGYFGSALCVLDLNGDGVSDLLVGAPNYAAKAEGELTYDQGAVYAYITRNEGPNIILEDAGSVQGSKESGARFGTAIADLGDIDGDGINDVAIGAPFENNGAGVVYIYRGSGRGLMRNYLQRISADGALSFGLSLSKGYDVDRNNVNDIAIGAFGSATAYIYRSIPTIQVISTIKVPDAKNLRQDAENFTAQFCITVTPNKLWSDNKIDLIAEIAVDPEALRAYTIDDESYPITVHPGMDACEDKIIIVNEKSDLSKPILLNFELKPAAELDNMNQFPRKSARLSENSVISSSFYIQLLSDCGADLICTPWLEMTLQPTGNTSIVPGTGSIMGAKIVVTNVQEPAYSVKLHVILPYPPKRLDSSCSLQKLDMICDLPAPLKRNRSVTWDFELEYTWDGAATEAMIAANLEDPVYQRHVSSGNKELVLKFSPYSEYNYTGKTESNATIVVTREAVARNDDIFFAHYFEFKNQGPSDLYNLKIEFLLPEHVSLASSIEGLTEENNTLTCPPFKLKANGTTAYHLPLRFNMTKHGKSLTEYETWNITSQMLFYVQYGSTRDNKTIEVTTTLILEPPTPLWPLIVAVVAGLLVLAVIILVLYKMGFFSRQKKEDLKQLIESQSSLEDPSSSSSNQLSLDNYSADQDLLDEGNK